MVDRSSALLRHHAFISAALLAASITSFSARAAEVSSTYVGANNGDWNTAANWSPAAIPINNGTDQYDPSITNLTVNFDVSGSSNINSLTLSGATLNLLSGDSLSVLNSGSITASNLTVNFAVLTANTITTVNSSNITATAGGTIGLSGVTSTTTANDGSNYAWAAQGSGSVLTANGLTTLNLDGSANFFVQATGGGLVSLASLTTLNQVGTRTFAIESYDANSNVNLPALGNSALSNISVQIQDGGQVSWGSPTTLNNSTLTIYGASTITVSSLTNVDTSQFSINNGSSSPTTPGSLNLSAVTSYTAANANVNETWSANGSGSTLTANSLTTLNLAGQATLYFSANNGGTVNLTGLTTLNNTGTRGLDFQAFGGGSTINIPALGPVGINNNNVTIEIHDGGDINWDSVGNYTTAFAGSTLYIYGGSTIDASHLTDVDASQFSINNGVASPATPGTLGLPGVTSYTTQNANVNEAWSANGSGSTLTANSLTTLNLAGQATLYFSANNGGVINLNALTTLNNTGTRNLDFQAFGTGSIINITALGPAGINNNNVYIEIHDGGTINWGSTTTFSGSSLTIYGAATINVSGLTNVDTSQFSINNGVVSTATPGILSLPSVTSYTALNANVNEAWSASGSGSTLSANSLTTLNLAGQATLFFTANNGGVVNLNALTTLNNSGTRNLDFQAFGAGSIVNISALGPAGINNNNVYIEIHDGGTINWDNSPSFTTTFAGSTLTIYGASTIDAAHLTNVNASQFSVNNGVASTATPGNLALPAITTYTAANANVNDYWNANGSGSTLSANSLTTLHLPGQANFFLSAANGGTVNLNALTTVDHSSGTRTFIIQSSNLNSNVNIDSLNSLQGGDAIELYDHGEATLGGFTTPFTLAFNAEFQNADGPLNIYINGDFYTSIAANNIGSYEPYTFDIPDPATGTVGFLANGDLAEINIQDYSATPSSVPEPASLALLAAGSLALLRRRRGSTMT